MPLAPLTVTLTPGQQTDVLKRFRKLYADELAALDSQVTEILTAIAEADYLGQFLGEQPEVKALKSRQGELATLEQRRVYLGKIIERLDAVVPAQPEVKPPLPGAGAPGARGGAGASGNLRRY